MKQKLFNRNFNLLILGQASSLLGNYTLKFALSMYVLEQTGSATIFAGLLALAMLPTILLSPLGGILADRANRRLSRATARLTELMAPDAVLDEEDPIACDEACDACPGCPEPVSEEPYEPMSELHPEDDVLDGDASEAFQASDSEGKSTEEEKKSVQSEAAPASEPVAKEAADDSDDEGIPWA